MNIDDFKKNKYIHELIEKYKNSDTPITDEILELNKNKINNFISNHIECDINKPCKQSKQGITSILKFDGYEIYDLYTNCVHSLKLSDNELIKKNYVYSDFNIDSFSTRINQVLANFKKTENENIVYNIDIKLSFSKNAIFNYVKRIKDIIDNDVYIKGLFIYSKPNTGKTYISKVSANEFAKKNKSVTFISAQNLIDKCKTYDMNENEKILINKISESDILFIDDIGNENFAFWSIDKVLFKVLNYRLENKKITFFSSNYTYDELFLIYSKKIKNNLDKVKIVKLISKIKDLSDEVNFNS